MEKERIIKALNKLEPEEAASLAWHYLQQATAEPCARIVNAETGQYALSFTANGTRYRVIRPEDGLGLLRAQRLRTEISKLGLDASLTSQAAVLAQIEQHFNRSEHMKAAAKIADMQHAINEALQKPFSFAVEACSLFIVTDDENIKTLPDQAQIARKVEDWVEEGISENDFFFLPLLWAGNWNKALQDFSLLVQGRKGELSV